VSLVHLPLKRGTGYNLELKEAKIRFLEQGCSNGKAPTACFGDSQAA
jgi:hypothetical protein